MKVEEYKKSVSIPPQSKKGLGMSHISSPTPQSILDGIRDKIPKEPGSILSSTPAAVSFNLTLLLLLSDFFPWSIYPTNSERLITFPIGDLTGYALEASRADAVTA